MIHVKHFQKRQIGIENFQKSYGAPGWNRTIIYSLGRYGSIQLSYGSIFILTKQKLSVVK